MGVCNCSMFCCTLLYVHFSIAIILMGKRELIALLNLSSWCLVMVERLFLTVPRGCLQFVIVVFPDHTHLLFLIEMIKWFSLAARKIVQGKMKLPKQTQKFMDRHQDDVRKLASAIVDPEVKRSIILKPGGGGFFGGVIIRSLI